MPVWTVGLRFQETAHKHASHHCFGALGECESVPDLNEGVGSHISAFALPEKSIKN